MVEEAAVVTAVATAVAIAAVIAVVEETPTMARKEITVISALRS